MAIMIQGMHTVALHDAETQLASVGNTRQPGFMAGNISVPDDFDGMGSNEIAALFYALPGSDVDAVKEQAIANAKKVSVVSELQA